MIHTVKEVLLENQIKENKILFELFTTPIETEIPVGETAVESGMTSIKVLVDDEELNLRWHKIRPF
jgi:ring-1,2-phenylacetyl-CoA epoxidase subunit PaaE